MTWWCAGERAWLDPCGFAVLQGRKQPWPLAGMEWFWTHTFTKTGRKECAPGSTSQLGRSAGENDMLTEECTSLFSNVVNLLRCRWTNVPCSDIFYIHLSMINVVRSLCLKCIFSKVSLHAGERLVRPKPVVLLLVQLLDPWGHRSGVPPSGTTLRSVPDVASHWKNSR